MRCLALALLIAFAAPGSAQEVLHATDDDLAAAREVYAESAAKEIKRQWLLLRSQYEQVELTGSLAMSVHIGSDGKIGQKQVVEKDGDITRLEQITHQAITQVQLKAMPPMLAKGLKARNLPMPSILIRVPFEDSGGSPLSEGRADEKSLKSRYIKLVTQAVEKKWHLFRALRKDQLTPGKLEVMFYVNKEGKVEDLQTIDDKDSNPLLKDFTLAAIRAAEIPPIPKEVLELLPAVDKQRLKIEYNVLIY
jgi:hypothetical protein